MKPIIGILGGRTENCSSEALVFAEAVGAEVAARGLALVSGGEDGIMDAASRGCKNRGGVTLGVMKWNHARDANDYIDYAIPTSMDLARANILIWMSSGLIAFEGRYGTATEIGLALDVGRPLVVTGEACLYTEAALAAPTCLRHRGNDPAQAGAVLDRLLALIAQTDLHAHARHG
jgi:hypothetical protein